MLKKSLLFLLIFYVLAGLPGNSSAEMQPVRKLRAGLPPYEVIKSVLSTNRQATDKIKNADQLTELKTPYLTWLTDADARIEERLILNSTEKPIFTIRNLGNQLALSTGTVDFGVRYLHTPILLITGSTDSLAIRMAKEGYSEMTASIRSDLDHLHIPLTDGVKQDKNAKKTNPVEQMLKTVEANIDFQVESAVNRYGDRVRSGRLVVVGGVIDLVDAYKRGPGRLIIININNERNDNKLKRLQIMNRLEKMLIQTHIGRNHPPIKNKK